MRLRAAAVVMSLLGALAFAVPAHAEGAPTRVDDGCDTQTDPTKDLKTVTFGYNGEAFQVGAETCGPYRQSGNWLITVHLTSFRPEVQITGLLQEIGRYEYWSGFRFCAEASCPLIDDPNQGVQQPSGSRLEDVDWGPGYDEDDCYPGPPCTAEQKARFAAVPRNPFAYGSWAKHLPAGTSLPSSIEWWAEVRGQATAESPESQLDRIPDSGTATSSLLPPGRRTVVTVSPGAAPSWQPNWGGLRRDTGTLRNDSGTGPAVATRLVSVPGLNSYSTSGPSLGRLPTDASGKWVDDYYLDGNATPQICFEGDGVNAAACSAPYHAYVRAFVSLDLKDGATLARNRPVDLRGVVRPRGTGDVEVLIKRAGTSDPWTVLRRTSLVAGRTDTYYRVAWTPKTAGHYVLVTRWLHGTTADGGVLNGQSDYRRVTVG